MSIAVEMGGIGQESIIFIFTMLIKNIALTTLTQNKVSQTLFFRPFNSRFILSQATKNARKNLTFFTAVEMGGIEPPSKESF